MLERNMSPGNLSSTAEVTISEPAKSGGTPATATATVKTGKITDIAITCAGSDTRHHLVMC